MVIWLVHVPIFGGDLPVRAGSTTTTVGPVAVVVVSLVAGLAAWALLALLERVSTHPRRTWLGVAGAGLLLSFVGPISSALTASTAGTLMAMHAVVGVSLMVGLSRRAIRTR
jgi:hypothetical protein